MLRKNLKGFTVIELAVVCIIIAVLSSIAVRSFTGYSEFAVKSRFDVLVDQLNHAHSIYLSENLHPRDTDITTLPSDITGSVTSSVSEVSVTAEKAYVYLKSYIPSMDNYASLSAFVTHTKELGRIPETTSLPYIIEYTEATMAGSSGKKIYKFEIRANDVSKKPGSI